MNNQKEEESGVPEQKYRSLETPSPSNQKSKAFGNQQSDEEDQETEVMPLEITVPGKIYRELIDQFPANPLLPKSFHAKDDSPRSGGVFKFLKLTRFRGADGGRSKFREEAAKIEKIAFPDGISMKKIFKVFRTDSPQDTTAPMLTAFGELVYSRNGNKDFISNSKTVTEGKDEVLDENLLDVKNLLKNATSSQAANGKQPGQKALVNMAGIDPFYTKKDKFDKTLIFESRFESGNLAAALKVSDNDYYLALQNDVNTSGNTQWFFFRVSNTKAYTSIRFNLLNLCKPDSLYNEGMKLLVYSEKHAAAKDIGWHRAGSKVAYYANGIRKDCSKSFKSLYTMTYTYEFEYEDDNVYFAYCYPYTYTELVEELNAIMADPIKQQYVQKKTLCETLAGNKCEVLTITSKQNPENMAKRKGVILTARVHPGESVGSWMMKGALDFLVDPESVEAEYLRQNFVFKIVPMLNPDGVINGNYRCSLAGCDLNRRWKRPSKVLHPTIYATKQLCLQFAKERELQIFCDFHGHSRRKNIFMYGCNVPGQPEDTRLFPFIMSQICPFFVYNYSRFGNQKSKESTARMALFNELKCPAIYTIESSFCGNDMGPWKNYHFSTNNLMQTGRDFCRTLMLYLPIQIPKSIVQTFLKNINDLYGHYKQMSDGQAKPDTDVENMQLYFERLEKVKLAGKEVQSKHIKKGLAAVLRQTADIFTDGRGTSSAGSDQAPSEDNLDLEEIEKVLPVSEDPDLAKKVKQTKTLRAEELKAQGESTNNSGQNALGLKRSHTIGTNQLKRRGTKLIPGGIKKAKLILKEETKIDDENEADDEGNGPENKAAPNVKTYKDEEQDKVLELRDPDSGNIIHKKKRRKNVESRDVQTQTDRSDYMLIKQRQQEKQKALMNMLAQKGEITQEESDEQLDMRGTYSQALNQQMIRKDLKSILGNNNDPVVAQKLLEEYLNQQKQGLVENILSQYNQQSGNSPVSKGASYQGVQFSNFVLQNQASKSMVQGISEESPKIKNSSIIHNSFGQSATSQSATSNSYSPSKKHRNLIQSRVGAAVYQNQPQIHTSQQFNRSQYPKPNSAAAEQRTYTAQQSYGGGSHHGRNHIVNTQGFYQAPSSSQLQGQTKWQKVSNSNHELTKLFYQLPGGTKSLVQNAIQQQNKKKTVSGISEMSPQQHMVMPEHLLKSAQNSSKKSSLQVEVNTTSKKPPAKGRMIRNNIPKSSITGYRQNPPQSASTFQQRRLNYSKPQDNYDFQLSMGQQENNSASVKHFEKRLTSVPTAQKNQSYQGGFSNVYVGQALAQAHIEPNSADNIMRKEIMQNALIQQQLKDMNGDLEQIGDQITASIVNKLEMPGNNFINVYNNFQSNSVCGMCKKKAHKHGKRC